MEAEINREYRQGLWLVQYDEILRYLAFHCIRFFGVFHAVRKCIELIVLG